MCDKKKKNKKKKTKKLSQFLKSHISGTRKAISLKFGMWSAAVGGHVHSKNRLVSSRKHRATEVRKLRFLSSCQYTHGCYAPALGPHDTLSCVLILGEKLNLLTTGFLRLGHIHPKILWYVILLHCRPLNNKCYNLSLLTAKLPYTIPLYCYTYTIN